jgi:hypothetical protein
MQGRSVPNLPTDAAAVEALARASLVAKFAALEGLPHVLDHAVYINSEQDFVRRFGVENQTTHKTQYRVLFVVFTGFEDSQVGCEDNPLYFLTYTLRVVVSLGEWADGNSTNDFASVVMKLRQSVLDERHLADYQQLRCENIKRDRSNFGLEEETGLVAHSADLSLRVEVTPS